jgi:hypothetical protein
LHVVPNFTGHARPKLDAGRIHGKSSFEWHDQSPSNKRILYRRLESVIAVTQALNASDGAEGVIHRRERVRVAQYSFLSSVGCALKFAARLTAEFSHNLATCWAAKHPQPHASILRAGIWRNASNLENLLSSTVSA